MNDDRRTLAGDLEALRAAVRHLGRTLATDENLAALFVTMLSVVAMVAMGFLITTTYLTK